MRRFEDVKTDIITNFCSMRGGEGLGSVHTQTQLPLCVQRVKELPILKVH